MELTGVGRMQVNAKMINVVIKETQFILPVVMLP